jgi:hypothetical protein
VVQGKVSGNLAMYLNLQTPLPIPTNYLFFAISPLHTKVVFYQFSLFYMHALNPSILVLPLEQSAKQSPRI